MQNDVDFYELLQISPNAEPETVHRVYRLLAQRFHPDNQESGNEARFRALHEAYSVLSDPEQRARYDVTYTAERKQRWRLAASPAKIETDYELEHVVRLTVLEVLCAKRRAEPSKPGVYFVEMEDLTGKPREHLEFTIWYLVQKKFVLRGDSSELLITADGIDYLEKHHESRLRQRRLTSAGTAAV
jgi:curved DNA-binding protein CbpA